MDLRVMKARRCLRRVPRVWLREIIEVAFNRQQILTFAVAIIGLIIILQQASPSQRDQEAALWAVSVQAFAIAVVLWAVISLIRAPLIVIREDRRNGTWHGNRFVYREPQLIDVVRSKATGAVERYRIRFPDAEPDSFVDTFVTLTPDLSKHARYGVGNVLVLGISGSSGRGGSRLEGYDSCFYIELEEKYVSVTARIYCEGFVVGNPDEKDGKAGDIGPEIKCTPQGYAVDGKVVGQRNEDGLAEPL